MEAYFTACDVILLKNGNFSSIKVATKIQENLSDLKAKDLAYPNLHLIEWLAHKIYTNKRLPKEVFDIFKKHELINEDGSFDSIVKDFLKVSIKIGHKVEIVKPFEEIIYKDQGDYAEPIAIITKDGTRVPYNVKLQIDHKISRLDKNGIKSLAFKAANDSHYLSTHDWLEISELLTYANFNDKNKDDSYVLNPVVKAYVKEVLKITQTTELIEAIANLHPTTEEVLAAGGEYIETPTFAIDSLEADNSEHKAELSSETSEATTESFPDAAEASAKTALVGINSGCDIAWG